MRPSAPTAQPSSFTVSGPRTPTALIRRDARLNPAHAIRKLQRHLPRLRPAASRVEHARHLLRPLPRRILLRSSRRFPLGRYSSNAFEARSPDLHAAGGDHRPLHSRQSFHPARKPRPKLWQQLPHSDRSLPEQERPAHSMRADSLLPRQHSAHPTTVSRRSKVYPLAGAFSPISAITLCRSFHASPFIRGSRSRNAG